MLSSLYLLVLEVGLVPLVSGVEVVSVDNMVTSPGCRLKHLISLGVIGLQEVLEIKVLIVLG